MTIHTPMTHTPSLTLPGEKDSMTAYVSDRSPALAPLAPFDFFRSSPVERPEVATVTSIHTHRVVASHAHAL